MLQTSSYTTAGYIELRLHDTHGNHLTIGIHTDDMADVYIALDEMEEDGALSALGASALRGHLDRHATTLQGEQYGPDEEGGPSYDHDDSQPSELDEWLDYDVDC